MANVLILGASPNPSRYSFLAAHALSDNNYPVVPVGLQNANVVGRKILDIRTRPEIEEVDTITIYMNPGNQKSYYEYILSLSPRRIIFNPGAENPELGDLASGKGIEVIYGCTLVMLSAGTF